MFLSPEVLRPLSASERLQLRARMNDLAERAAARFLKAVRPIFAATRKGEPDHIGSSILLDIRGVKVLLTAAHIVDQNEAMDSTLYVGGEGRPVKIEAEFFLTAKPAGGRNNDQYDFAAAQLPAKMLDELGDGFVSEGDITTQVQPGHLYTALGFPNSQNKNLDRKTSKMVVQAVRYSSTSRFNDAIAKRLSSQGGGSTTSSLVTTSTLGLKRV
jgi:hypothetical protein